MGKMKNYGICKKGPKNFFIMMTCITVLSLFSAFNFIGCSRSNNNSTDKNDSILSTKKSSPNMKESNKDTENKKESAKVTYENFLKIEMGEKYSAVAKILGEGKETFSLESFGYKTSVYSWKNTDFSYITVSFQDDAVVNKTQISLKPKNDKITLDKYNQTKEGMTIEEVKTILGDGQLSSHTLLFNVETKVYLWINKDGSNANLTFTNNELKTKIQTNLK